MGLLMYVTVVGLCLMRRKIIAAEAPAWPLPDSSTDLDLETASLDPASDVSEASRDVPTPASRAFITPLRILNLAVWLIAASAVCISIWLQKVSLYELLSFCPWCMTSAFLVSCIFLLSSKDLFMEDRKFAGEQKLLAGTVGFIAVMSALMVVP